MNLNQAQMAISRSTKLTDTERRMQTLKIQLYGKEGTGGLKPSHNFGVGTFHLSSTAEEIAPSSVSKLDTNYLKNDLLKICLLASLAIGTQLMLYLALQKGLIKFG